MVRRVVGWTGEVLITLGVLLLLFAAWQLWWTDVVADRATAQVVERLRDDFAPHGGAVADDGPAAPPVPGDAFALMYVPRLGSDWVRPVLEGTDASVLAEGVGHYDGTAAPGEVGNFAVAGHRTTWGRPFHDIDRLRADDRVVVQTADHVYVYAVTGHEIVRPWQTEVVAPVPDEPGATPTERMLTMTSCHPRYSATERYVVHAALEATLAPDELGDALTVSGEG
jgi:sortase A